MPVGWGNGGHGQSITGAKQTPLLSLPGHGSGPTVLPPASTTDMHALCAQSPGTQSQESGDLHLAFRGSAQLQAGPASSSRHVSRGGQVGMEEPAALAPAATLQSAQASPGLLGSLSQCAGAHPPGNNLPLGPGDGSFQIPLLLLTG